MKRYSSIPVITVLALATCVASAQQRGARPQTPPRFNAPPAQREAPPPQLQPQRPDRGDRNTGQQNPNPSGQQRPGDRRFVFQGPGPHAGDWLRRHEDEPVDKQLKELENDPTFKKMPPDRQQQFRNRLNHFNSLPPQQRDRMLNNLDIIEHMTPQQQERARSMFSDLRQLPEDRRRALSGAFRDLRGMSPEYRQRTIDSDDYRRNYSEKEREILRGMSDLGLYPNNGSRD